MRVCFHWCITERGAGPGCLCHQRWHRHEGDTWSKDNLLADNHKQGSLQNILAYNFLQHSDPIYSFSGHFSFSAPHQHAVYISATISSCTIAASKFCTLPKSSVFTICMFVSCPSDLDQSTIIMPCAILPLSSTVP